MVLKGMGIASVRVSDGCCCWHRAVCGIVAFHVFGGQLMCYNFICLAPHATLTDAISPPATNATSVLT